MKHIIEPDKRYALQFLWIGRDRTGHVISADRMADGTLRLYDPQIGKTYIKQEVLAYLKQIKYTMSLGGKEYTTPPKILRIDDKQFNLDVVNYIMEGVRK